MLFSSWWWLETCSMAEITCSSYLLWEPIHGYGFSPFYLWWTFLPLMKGVVKFLFYKELLTLWCFVCLGFFIDSALWWFFLTIIFYSLSGLFWLLLWDWWSPVTFYIQTRNWSVIFFLIVARQFFSLWNSKKEIYQIVPGVQTIIRKLVFSRCSLCARI